MTFAHGETITRLRGTPVADPYSAETVLGWDAPSKLDIDGVGVEPITARTAPAEARQAVTIGYVLYCPAGADITAADRVRVRGRDHRVTGEPAAWRSPMTGWAPGTVVNVEGVEG